MSKLQHMTYERGLIPPIQVHHRLRIAREWANLEQGELAERIGISRNSVSAAERGVTRPRKITLNARVGDDQRRAAVAGLDPWRALRSEARHLRAV